MELKPIVKAQPVKRLVCLGCGEDLGVCVICEKPFVKGDKVVEAWEDGHPHLSCAVDSWTENALTVEEEEVEDL